MKTLVQMALDLFDPPAPPPVQAPDLRPTIALSDAMAPAQFAHPQANRSILLRHTRVAYHFKRAKRRTIGMVVGPDGLVVSAPRWVVLAEVESALQEKGDWIVRKLDEMRERSQRMAQQKPATRRPQLGHRLGYERRHVVGHVVATRYSRLGSSDTDSVFDSQTVVGAVTQPVREHQAPRLLARCGLAGVVRHTQPLCHFGTEKQHHKNRTPPLQNCRGRVHALLLRLRVDTMSQRETPVKRNA